MKESNITAFSTHFVRGAFFIVLLFLVVQATPLSRGQGRIDNNAATIGPSDVSSQNFEAAFDGYDAQVFPPEGESCTFNGSIEASDPMQTGRIFRDDPASTCAVPQTCSTFDAAPKHYDSYTFTNTTGSTQCVTVTLDAMTCVGTQFLQAVAYLGSFNPASICTNYLADIGASPNPTKSFSFNLAAGQTLVLVINETNENAGCAAYSVTVSGLCAPTVIGAVSRKTHGTAGIFDVNLPLTGTPGVECRSGGGTNDFTMRVTFASNVTVTGSPQAQVTFGIGTIGSGGVSNGGAVTVSGNIVTIPLTNVADQQSIQVRLNGVNNASLDEPAVNVLIPMTRLLGDTNGNRAVNAGDVSQTKSRIGQAVTTANFRSDFNTSGGINAGDVAIAKSNTGHGLP